MNELRVGLRGLADAWAGPVDEVGRDGHDAFVLHRADRRPAGARRYLLRFGGVVRGGEHDDLGIAAQDLLGGELRVRARRARRDVLSARDLDEVVDVRAGADGEDLVRVRGIDLVIDPGLRRRGRRLRPDVIDALLDVARHRFAVAADSAPEQDRGPRDVTGALRIDDEDEQPGTGELLDRAVGELHAEHEVRFQGDDLFEVDLDAPDLLELLRGGRLVREVVRADDARSRPEREEELGDRRTDGDDAFWALGYGDGAVLEVRDGRRECRGAGGRDRGRLQAWDRRCGGATGGGEEEEDGKGTHK